MSISFCPSCGKNALDFKGITGVGNIYECKHCKNSWVISRYDEEDEFCED